MKALLSPKKGGKGCFEIGSFSAAGAQRSPPRQTLLRLLLQQVASREADGLVDC
jgi:hypothetical protein